jgi:hypothetical protein
VAAAGAVRDEGGWTGTTLPASTRGHGAETTVVMRRSVVLHGHQGIVDARAAVADPVHLPEAIDNQRLRGVPYVGLRDTEMTGKAGEAPREREVFAYRLSDTFRELSLLNRPVSRRLPVGVNGQIYGVSAAGDRGD